MSIRIITLACLLTLSSSAVAQAGNPGSQAARATTTAEHGTEAAEFLAEIDTSLELAGNGEYGRLKRGDMGRMETARDEIKSLLDGHASASELPPEERLALYNAQELITSILRNDDKQRVICQTQAVTGTRHTTTECLTVEQREHRARVGRTSTDGVQRTVCVPGGGNPCG